MSFEGSIEIVGLKEALRELNQLNPQMRRQVTKDFQKITAPVVAAAKQNLPSKPPMSGWAKGWKTPSGFQMLPSGGWSGSTAGKFIKSQVSGKKPREYAGQMQNAAVFLVKFAGMVNTVFSVSGRKNKGNSEQGENMIKVLEFRYGKPSRVLWPAYEANKAEVEKQVIELTKRVMAETGKRLK
jgi:hypothetical protein